MIGEVLVGRYEILKALGAGGFGETFLALDRHMPGQVKCVVKRLRPQQVLDPVGLRLFNKEAEILYRLGSHPQIPKLLAHFQEENNFYLVQDYVEGHNLDREFQPGFPWEEKVVIGLLKQILKILTYVHQEGIIHRDIKPANVMRRHSDGEVVLIDFGSVKQLTQGEASLTIGIQSQGYTPLEQVEGKPHFASDIYALGMMGIQALTGIPPSKLERDPRTLKVSWQDHTQVSSSLAAILNKMVAPYYADRYFSAGEALQALQRLVGDASSDFMPPKTEITDIKPSSSITAQSSTSKPTVRDPFWRKLWPSTKTPITAQLETTLTAHAGGVRSLALDLEGRFLVTGGVDRVLKVWNTKTWQLEQTLQGHSNAVYALALNPTGQILASSSDDQTIRIWQMPSGQERYLLQLRSEWATSVVFSPDSRGVFTATQDTLKLWGISSTNRGNLLCVLRGHSDSIQALAISADGQWLVSSSQDKTIRVWNLDKEQVLKVLKGHTGSVDVIVMNTPQTVMPTGIKQVLISGSSDSTIKVWDLDRGKERCTLTGHTQRVTALALSPNGSLFASGSADQTIRLWSLPQGKELRSLRGHRNVVTALSFNRDGSRLLSSSLDGTIKIWMIKSSH
jgi:WD40 repeat protein